MATTASTAPHASEVWAAQAQVSPGHAPEWLPALRRLDDLLGAALPAAEAPHDPFRGLHIGPAEARALLDREPGAPRLACAPGAAPAGRLAWLSDGLGLSPFDLDVVVIALAPEVDLRYERLYAYLQDDIRRTRPRVDLALDLLCGSADARIARRAHFAPDAPLLARRIVTLSAPEPGAPLLAQAIALDPQIVDLLLAQGGLDRRLAGFCRLDRAPAGDADLEAERADLAAALAAHAAGGGQLRLYLRGPADEAAGLAGELAARLGVALLRADLAGAPAGLGGADLAAICFREALLQRALLLVENLDALSDDAGWMRALRAQIAGHGGPIVLSGSEPWRPDLAGEVATVERALPGPAARRAHWRRALSAAGVAAAAGDLDALAGRFRLRPGQIAAAARGAGTYAALAGRATVDRAALLAAARAQSGRRLAGLARKIAPAHAWADLVLPDDALDQLREICHAAAVREQVLQAWGRMSRGRGISALFAGPSGTGKTMAAEVIAGELGLDLYAIDLAGVVSKYIGETEKNLDRIFRAAEDSNAVLLFDEADALFGKRSEVKDSHDRYANIEVSYLLQRIEQYDGVAILATNLRQQLDEAFLRRLSFSLSFPFPDPALRERIWRAIWPAGARLAADVDLGWLAAAFRLSGGNIRNVALAASMLAAGGQIDMGHLRHAVRREYQKLGKALSPDELAGGVA